jgi:hypothetical protein
LCDGEKRLDVKPSPKSQLYKFPPSDWLVNSNELGRQTKDCGILIEGIIFSKVNLKTPKLQLLLFTEE